MKYSDVKTCTPKCRSHKHALELISLMTKTNDTNTILSALIQCYNSHKIQDQFGRNLLHMASSIGRVDIIEWLIEFKKIELNLKTFENGWTPAHCACFYGNIDCLIALIKHGANLTKNDYDRLTPIESLSLDKYSCLKYEADLHDELDVYSWGSNENYNLGMGNDQKKTNAEMCEFFKKLNINIIEIVMSKFHTVFLSRTGEVYTCGFGADGRLGHDNELTLFTPKLVEELKNQKCVQIDASRNNTYFLTNEGTVYSCGTNEFKQLGQIGVQKSLIPKPINLGKRLKGKLIKQISCSRFHVVLLTSSNEVYTFGLNAGQLGHPNETVANAVNYNNSVCYVNEPRLITSLNEPDIDISLIACSDGSSLCLQNSKNCIHLFNDYKPRRLYYIKETGSVFKKLKCLGGKLDSSINSELKWIKELEQPIQIVGLTDKNLLYIWKETDPCWKNLVWSKNKNLKIVDFDLNDQGLIFCTLDGSCYKADFKSSKNHQQKTQSDLKTEMLDVTRIPLMNRTVRVSCDLKARNFFSLQYNPGTLMRLYPTELKTQFKSDLKNFYDESENFKEFYDLELKFKDKIFYLHKFLLLSRSPKFFLKLDLINKTRLDGDQFISSKLSSQSFELILNYFYSSECSKDLIKKALKSSKISSEQNFCKFITDFKETCVDKFGFLELKQTFETNSYLKLLKELNLNHKDYEEKLELMSEFFFKILDLKILKASSQNRKQFRFNRESYPDLYDCQIELNNQKILKCHKCVLIARSEFFRNMLLGCWIESNSASIKLPFDLDLMQILVDYLYTDEIQMDFIHTNTNYTTSLKSKSEKEIEILFNLYVLSDQLLMERIKNLCEFKLANLVNLKNVCEIFEFSDEFQAKQLKEFCMEFISTNLVTLVESKQLETVNLRRLTDLSNFYRSYFNQIDSRRITPYTESLDPSKIELIPIDLIYDQDFLNEDETIHKKRIPNRSEDFKEVNNNDLKTELSPVSPNVEEESQEVNETKAENKWEKVKKKKSRKISENENTKKPSPTVVGAFYSEKDVEKYNDEKKIYQEQDEWPLLARSSEKQSVSKFKVLKSNKSSPSSPIVKTPPVADKQKIWGSDSTPTCSNSSFSLMDIINEEMKKVNISKNEDRKETNIVKSQTEDKIQTQTRGWNLSEETKSQNASIAQIIEMEKRSTEKYKKLKNRPLNSIQLEEKAIEDLKKIYQVDFVTDITITIELIDEDDDFNGCVPVWKKN